MGKNTPYIMEGDGESDIEVHIVELLGLDFYEYLNDNSILDRSVLESNIGKILRLINDPAKDSGYFIILGYFILKTGAAISDELKKKIIEATNWEYEQTIYPSRDMEEERKVILKDLRDKILNHKPGKVARLIEDGGGYAPELLLQEKNLTYLLEKGYSLVQIRDYFMGELSEKISEEHVLANIKWHFHINSNNLSEKIFKQVQRKLLKQKFVEYFGKGVRTLDEMNRKFISPMNPDGISFKKLESLVKDSLSVKSWEEAIEKHGYPTDGWVDTYIEQVCGIDTEKFTEEEEVITREMVKVHFDELIEMISRWANPIGYYKFGMLILKTGAELSEDVRRLIIESTNNLKDFEPFDEKIIQSFQNKIRAYKSGQVTEH